MFSGEDSPDTTTSVVVLSEEGPVGEAVVVSGACEADAPSGDCEVVVVSGACEADVPSGDGKVVVVSGACEAVASSGDGEVAIGLEDDPADWGPAFASARGTWAAPLSPQFWGEC